MARSIIARRSCTRSKLFCIVSSTARQLGVVAVVAHAVDQVALFHDHLFGWCNVPHRLGKMVMLGCRRFLARARLGRFG